MNNRNYQRELDALITGFEKENKVPRLFLHSCCAPCSSYVLEYLSKYFEITVFFYNPNISPKEEYEKRVEEIRRMIGEMNFIHPVKLVEGTYDPRSFSGWQKGWSRFPKEESGVFAVIVSAWRRRRSWQRKAVMIILQPLCPSVL